MADEVVYRSRVSIERVRGPLRRAHLPLGETVVFGVHDEVAAHYGTDMSQHEAHSTTLDYIIAAAAG